MICAATTDRFAQGEAERVGWNGIHVAGDFCREASVVFEAGGDVGDVVFGLDDRLAGVAALKIGEGGGVFADFFGELKEDTAAILRGRLPPRAVVEGFAGGFDGSVNVGFVGCCHVGDDFFGRRIVDGEGFAARGCDPLIVDEIFVGFGV